ncbi:MAG: hypothetical protein WBE58_15425, partial [Verrucomicrobiales bacterium]
LRDRWQCGLQACGDWEPVDMVEVVVNQLPPGQAKKHNPIYKSGFDFMLLKSWSTVLLPHN